MSSESTLNLGSPMRQAHSMTSAPARSANQIVLSKKRHSRPLIYSLVVQMQDKIQPEMCPKSQCSVLEQAL